MNCGSSVDDDCVGTTFNMESAGEYNVGDRANKLLNEIISIGTFLITVTLATGTSSMSKNMIYGVNALRCAFLNGFVQFYHLVAAAYYLARVASYHTEIQILINEYYPYLCTCKNDVSRMSEYFGSSNTEDFETCGDQ